MTKDEIISQQGAEIERLCDELADTNGARALNANALRLAKDEIERLRVELDKWKRAGDLGHSYPCTLGPQCPYCEINRLRAELDDQRKDTVCDELRIADLMADVQRLGEENERLREAVKFLNSFRPDAELAKRDAEIERLRAYIAEIEKWKDEGERIIGPAAEWGQGGNVMVQSSVMLKLGAWWADRPWRTKDIPYCASCGKQKERCDGC